jgi:hypothetical protein
MSPSPIEVQVTDHVTKNDNHKTNPTTTSNDEVAHEMALNLHIEYCHRSRTFTPFGKKNAVNGKINWFR